jgi:hypothetical protein
MSFYRNLKQDILPPQESRRDAKFCVFLFLNVKECQVAFILNQIEGMR